MSLTELNASHGLSAIAEFFVYTKIDTILGPHGAIEMCVIIIIIIVNCFFLNLCCNPDVR